MTSPPALENDFQERVTSPPALENDFQERVVMPPAPSNAFLGAGGDVTRPYKYFLKYPKTCFISRKIANHIQKNSKIDPTIVESH